MVHVPYKGNGPALVDLMAGVLNLTFSDLAGASPFIKAGKLRPLAIASARRSPSMPELPTMIEAGVPGFQAAVVVRRVRDGRNAAAHRQPAQRGYRESRSMCPSFAIA